MSRTLTRLLFPACLTALAACSTDPSSSPPPVGTATDVSTTLPPSTMTGMTASGSSTDASGTDASGSTSASGSSTTRGADTTGEPPPNCQDLLCSDNGKCLIDDSGGAYCLCDDGYVFDKAQTTCIVDETCIDAKFLEDGCRQKLTAEPAVALFFALDFCAGTAVTPDKFRELGLSFEVRENSIDISENVESDATILDTDVESYVTLVLDVSNSLTESEDLPALVTEIRDLASSLEAEPGEPDVYVSVYVFGFGVAEYVPFTRNFAQVDTMLAALAADPGPVVDLAGGGGSTALFRATEKGIEETRRIRELRDAVTWGGVLTTGTIVVVTDGIDSSNADLNTQIIESTTNQVISIGVSSDINDEELRAIGRDGSFLAPTPADWITAFDSIAQRVDEYPERSYLLAYCSSASEGSPDVEIGVGGATLTQVQSAECTFNADLFSSQGFECNADFFVNECNTLSCGGLTGCGACPDSQCCDGTQCSEPSSAQDTGIDCSEQPHTCEADNLTCGPLACELPVGEGEDCGGDVGEGRCSLGVDFCEDGSCVDALTVGSPCNVPAQCASLNCYYPNPDNPFEGRRCLPEARIGDHCGPEDAICEAGAHCQGGSCTAKRLERAACGADEHCRQGLCQSFDTGGNFCQGPDACYWPWDSKVPN